MTAIPAPVAGTSVRSRLAHSAPQEGISDFVRSVATSLMGGPEVVRRYPPGVFNSYVIVVEKSIQYAQGHITQGADGCAAFIDAMAVYLAHYTKTSAIEVRAPIDAYYHAHPGELELEDMLIP